jgi:hypothetical protein
MQLLLLSFFKNYVLDNYDRWLKWCLEKQGIEDRGIQIDILQIL